MRVRLCIDRPGDLPTVKLLWNTNGLRLTRGSKGPELRVADLLQQVDEVIPLRLQENWDLDDYVVEKDGFECLHFCGVDQVFSEDDLITIRPKTLRDVRTRKIGGRDQISTAGVRLYDGVPWDRPFIRTTSRPAIEPPKKVVRLSPQVLQDEICPNALSESCEPVTGWSTANNNPEVVGYLNDEASSNDSNNEQRTPVGRGNALREKLAAANPARLKISSLASKARTDGRRVVKPKWYSGRTKQTKQVRFAQHSDRLSGTASDHDSEVENTELENGEQSGNLRESLRNTEAAAAAAAPAALKLGKTTATAIDIDDDDDDSDYDDDYQQEAESSEGTSSSGSSYSGSDSSFESGSGSDDVSDTDSQSETSSSLESLTGAHEIEPAPATHPAELKLLTKHNSQTYIPPRFGLTRTQKRNERKAWSKKLARLKDLGILEQDANIQRCRDFYNNDIEGEPSEKITATFEKQRAALIEKLRNGGIEVSEDHRGAAHLTVESSSTQPLSAGEDGVRTSAPALGQRLERVNRHCGAESLTGKIKLTAVECCYNRNPYTTPPFPFVQRWHKTRRADSAQNQHKNHKRKHSEMSDSHVTLDYEEEDGVQALCAHPITEPATRAAQADECSVNAVAVDLPFPKEVAELPQLVNESAKAGAVIAFKELEVSEDTQWMPQISAYKTAKISGVNDDGSLLLQLALRDQKVVEKKYDLHTGQRMYSRFEGPDMSDEENSDLAEKSLAFEDLIEPLLVVPASGNAMANVTNDFETGFAAVV